jgi:hypothetical protein
LRAHDEQYVAIRDYLKQTRVPVFYQFYNPATLPWVQRFPLPMGAHVNSFPFATRILPAREVISILDSREKNYSPSVADFSRNASFDSGWRLEHFVADLLVGCKEGYVHQDPYDNYVFDLFNRRRGAIAAAVAFSIHAPE